MLSLMRNGVVCFMIDMSNGYDMSDCAHLATNHWWRALAKYV